MFKEILRNDGGGGQPAGYLGGQLVALIVAGSSEKRGGVQWRSDLPRPESKEMGMTLNVRYDAAERQM